MLISKTYEVNHKRFHNDAWATDNDTIIDLWHDNDNIKKLNKLAYDRLIDNQANKFVFESKHFLLDNFLSGESLFSDIDLLVKDSLVMFFMF